MCGRYTLTRQDGVIDDLQATLGVEAQAEELRAWWKPRFNIAPTQPAPVVIMTKEGVRTLEMMRWGLVPHWAPADGKKAPLMINARVETVATKPVYRRELERHRCLVPADGFFEWKREGKATPLPFYIHPVPRRVIAFAGIWMRAGDLFSFAVITGPANDLVAPIHDRMPIVIEPADYATWLDRSVEVERARALLHVPAIADWQIEPVSTRVNKAANDDPSCIELVPPPAPPPQGSLF